MMATPDKAPVVLGQLLPHQALAPHIADTAVGGLALDSRRVSAGDLFLAVCGTLRDGREFIPQALSNGCSAVLAEAVEFDELYPVEGTVVRDLAKAGIPLVLVENLQQQVSAIAARYYGEPGSAMDIVGITGTNGKTTCASLVAQIAARLQGRAGLIGTLGWGMASDTGLELKDTGMTTPDAVRLQAILAQLRDRKVSTLAMEVSSHSLDQGRVTAAGINCGVFTNLSRDHLDYHGSEANYAAAKARLFALGSLERAVVNIDDTFGARLYAGLAPDLNSVSYGLSAQAMVRASNISLTAAGVAFDLASPWGEAEVHSGLLGEFNVLNLLAAISVFCSGGVALNDILAAVADLVPVPGRMEVLTAPDKAAVVVDYAHTPDALAKALGALRQHCRGTLWCVFGCGGDRDAGKRPQMGSIAAQLADRIIVTSDNPRSESPRAIVEQILAGMTDSDKADVEVDRRAAIEKAVADAAPDDWVLIAGKGHETYQQIGDSKHPFSDVAVASAALGLPGEGSR